ncbi:MAG: restriction endonuclease subunit S [Sphingomonadaceae bacterium]
MSLPEGWAETTIGEAYLVIPKHPADIERGQNVSFVPMPAVDEHLGAIVGADDRELSEIWTGYTHFADGDVIFAKITPCMENGKAAIARNLTNGMACGSTEFYVFRPEGGVSAEYLWRYLRQQSFRDEAESHMSGAVGQRRVPRDYLENHQLPLPPLAEQRRIVAKLDALTARLTRARAELDRVPVLAKRLRESVLRRVFAFEFQANCLGKTEGETEVANTSLDKLAEFNPKHAKTLDRNISVSFVPMAAVSDVSGEIVSNTARSLSEVCTGYTHFADGDVIFAKITPCMENGKAAVVKDMIGGMGCVSTELHVMRTGRDLRAKLLWYLLRSAGLRGVAETKMTGAVGQRRVPRKFLEGLRIQIRSLAEQDKAIRCLDAAFARADRLEAEAAEARALLDRMEAAILARAFRGELVPQDPADEPAHLLLDRIRTVSAAAPKPKRGRRKNVKV